MSEKLIQKSSKITFPAFASVAALLIFLLIVYGDVTRRVGLGEGYSAGLLLAAVFALVFAAGAAWRSYREARWVTGPITLSVVIIAVQTLLILIRVNPGTSSAMLVGYVTNTLIVHAMAITAAVVAFNYHAEQSTTFRFTTPFAKMSILVTGLVFVALVSGVFVTVTSAAGACSGFPLCGNGWELPTMGLGWIHVGHRVVVGLAALSMLVLFRMAWRTQRYQTAILVSATAATVMFMAQMLVGGQLGTGNLTLDLIGLHSAAGTAAWAMLVVLVVQVGLSARTVEVENLSTQTTTDIRTRAKDFLTLTKPIVVLLLLVTTYAGMVVGAKAFPSFALTFWTIMGGALAAGGSAAINQYIDRDLDKMMKRTAKRPLAAKRLTPAEGLAFGVALCLTAFFVLAVFANLLAAVLSVVGMFYYVWLYSILLKNSTVQNIVIGGGAGAIPPLVGWAAATGSLTIESLLLFAIIFMWTPPHFWALALVRVRDYARGGVPMLPVVRGEMETRKQIFWYTIWMVAVTLIAPFVGLGGWLYTIPAVLMGVGLIFMAWRIYKAYTPKLGWKMYRYTSMYLAFLFFFMVMDAVL
jgi:protoheme IX farnesyltransferase